MKTICKYLSVAALSTMICVSLAIPASAQHNHPSGGGGGGSRPAGGGFSGGHVSAAPSRPAPSQRPASTSRPAAQRNYTTQRTQYSGHTTTTTRRTGVTAQSYRASQGSAYGRNHPGIAYGSRGGFANGGYHYNHGYYRSSYAPRLGFSIGFLPFGYYPFYYGDYQYFYSDGFFYEYNNDQYTVVEPPVGAEVTSLPANAQSIVINGQQYYEADGVYYEPITKDDGTLSYQVAGKDGELNTTDSSNDGSTVDNAPPPVPQIGDIVNQLPPNCRKINVNGQKLYLAPDGTYYQAQVDQNNNTTYKIVGLPDDQGGDQGGN